MSPLFAVAAIAGVFFVLWAFGFLTPPPDPVVPLRRHALQLLGWGPRDGPRQLAERLDQLRARFPGKSERWLLQWLVDDLKRAKR